jgi:hypothetical protein
MTYVDAWKPIASRIHALREAAVLYARFLSVNDSDAYGIYKQLHAQCVQIAGSINEFRRQFETTLPIAAIEAITRFVAYADLLDGRDAKIKGALEGMGRSLMIALAAFEGKCPTPYPITVKFSVPFAM